MKMEQRRDMKFAGSMTVPGGLYKRVTCNGSITVDGDIDCPEIKMNGTYNGTGKTKATNAVINGGGDFSGDLKVEDLKMSGQAIIDGGLSGGSVKADDKLSVRKDVKVDRATIVGQLVTRGQCGAEMFSCNGFVEIEGSLNSGDVNTKLYGLSHVKEIGGEKINVRKGHESMLGKIATALFDTLGFH
jgi:cytoskeletal protein CcmA (bactofilin family)